VGIRLAHQAGWDNSVQLIHAGPFRSKSGPVDSTRTAFGTEYPLTCGVLRHTLNRGDVRAAPDACAPVVTVERK
jgi:hypothetical protein